MKKSSKQAIEISAGVVTAAALAAAAAYWVSSQATKSQRVKAKAWLKKAHRDVAKQAASAKKFGQKEYERLVDQTIAKYGSLEDVSMRDIKLAAKQLKAEWKRIQAHAKKQAAKKKRRAAKKKK